ncbi:phosphotyrosine protein phosphatase [Sphingobium sufflavum]|uniref:arsenate reductase/protein-tyrosine-phosphatase family protein n=1 Tax=Sphingobium sufflavum TaxID=1129547 RepID=UPI001F2F3E14|nr:phosphotyrosine protein phosphatase [Sphingobium sufflavum]MCE7798630.1 phosphotyrosine protein phosphatase [Sphingobium sufflavum]
MIQRRFGTFRGLVRLALAPVELATGRGAVRVGSPDAIRRLVFICHGNICRSAFADVAARRAGLAVTSFGLSTDSGKPAHGPAIDAAAALGHDLSAHRATMMSDYEPREGDLLLAMETRQLRRLAADPRLGHVPRSLLGLYTRPRVPHLHDPYSLSEAYMKMCLARIETAMPVLRAAFPNARAG